MSDQTGFDPKRRLCPDGTCTGIIGRDGRCGECGRTAGGTPAGAGVGGAAVDNGAAGTTTDEGWPDASTDGVQTEAGADDGDGPAETTTPGAGGPGFDPKRRLCDDGACLGVVGPNGACTVCGRVAG